MYTTVFFIWCPLKHRGDSASLISVRLQKPH